MQYSFCSRHVCFGKMVKDSAIVQPNYHVHKDIMTIEAEESREHGYHKC